MTGMKLRDRITDFTYNLRTFYAVVEIEVIRRSRTDMADRIRRD
jgi:hypothetical protein